MSEAFYLPYLPNHFNYVLILAALFSHYYWGKYLGFTGLFTSSLVGLCISSLITAIFANFAAGLIPYFLNGFLVVSLSLTIVRYNKVQPKIELNHVMCFLILAVLIVINDYNWMIHDGDIQFDLHYTYFAAPSLEMLRADYFDRLKIFNAYPMEWSNYPFFQAASHAVLLKPLRPTLLSFFQVKNLLNAAIVCAWLETIFVFCSLKSWRREIWISIITLSFAFITLGLSVSWNFNTNGAYSNFFLPLICIFIAYGSLQQVTWLILLMGLSSVRLMPLALILYVWVNMVQVEGTWKQRWKFWLDSLVHDRKFIGMCVIGVMYCFVTIYPHYETSYVMSKEIFSHGWMSVTQSYQTLSELFHVFGMSYLKTSWIAGMPLMLFAVLTAYQLLFCSMLILLMKDQTKQKKLFVLTAVITISSVFIQLGGNDDIRAPILFAGWDIWAFGLFLVLLVHQEKTHQYAWALLTIIAIMTASYMKPYIMNTVRVPGDKNTSKIHMVLLKAIFTGEEDMLFAREKDFYYMMIGKRLKYNPDEELMSHRYIKKIDPKEK